MKNISSKIVTKTVEIKNIVIISTIGIFILAVFILLYSKGFFGQAMSIEKQNRGVDFELRAVQGDNYSLKDYKGKSLMVTFIYISSDYENKDADQSRAQLNFIKSMQTQYESKGMNFVLVDSSYLINDKVNDAESLTNFTHDWKLDNIPLLKDTKNDSIAKKYNITRLPTTILFDQNGSTVQRWDGLVLTSQLATGIEQLVGDPVHRNSETQSQNLNNIKSDIGEGNTAKAIFKGFDSAQALSEKIWLVDGGNDWNSKSPTPIRLIVTEIEGKLTLGLDAIDIKTGERFELFKEAMEQLPKAEAEQITQNFQHPQSNLSIVTKMVSINKPGSYKIIANVKDASGKKTLDKGEVTVYVK